MTAEGDNRVLMQKVAKELLSTVNTPRVRARIQVPLKRCIPSLIAQIVTSISKQAGHGSDSRGVQ